jgi:hypothetical protein
VVEDALNERGTRRLRLAGPMLPWTAEEILSKIKSLTPEERERYKLCVDWAEEYELAQESKYP